MLPNNILELIDSYEAIGFSGSRNYVSHAVHEAIEAIENQQVLVGCARGVDTAVRTARSDAHVFRACEFGTGRGAFAARSIHFVDVLHGMDGLLLCFPYSHCPDKVMPSAQSGKAFCGGGSGSWATLAYATGCGVRSAVFLPATVPLPAGGWRFELAGQGWYVSEPAVVQARLF